MDRLDRSLADRAPRTAAPQTPAAIAAQLERDRAALTRSIEGLKDKMMPRALLDDAKTFAKTSIAPHAKTVESVVKDHPVASALVGAGVAWLAFGRGKRGAAPVAMTAAQMAPTEPHDGAEASAYHQWVRATQQGPTLPPAPHSGRRLVERPLLAAGVGVAIGAAIGAALPRTAVEDRVLGPDRDQLWDQARAMLRDTNANTSSSLAGSTGKAIVATLASQLVAKLASDLIFKAKDSRKSPAQASNPVPDRTDAA